MRILVQRVKNAKVNVAGNDIPAIGYGLLIFVGIGKDDGNDDIDIMARKIANLRIFEDEHGKMNLNIKQVKGRILSVPQFTLYADTRRGNRPGFEMSAEPEMAKELWVLFNDKLISEGIEVEAGVFGARMEVSLINDGPVTIWLDLKKDK